MKLPVVSQLRVSFATRICALLVIASTFLAPVVSAQTTKRGSNKRAQSRGEAVTKARPDTLKICQGVPLPPGYVIVAYMTSSACPHGAYVIKKQDAYSESVATGYTKPAATGAPATSTSDPAKSAPPTSRPAAPADYSANSDIPHVDDPFATQPSKPNSQSVVTSPQISANATSPSGPGSRPRRVANSPAANNVANNATNTAANTAANPTANTSAVVADDEPARPVTPPRWAGTAPSNSPGDTSSDVVADSGPEEVAEGDVIKVETSLVSVPVSVMDRQGRFIPDLKREDFTVSENGVEQKIAHFEPAEKPFTVALLLDTSPSTQFQIAQIKEAAVAFARQLRPQDKVLIVSFNDQVLLLTEMTNDLNVISSVIEEHATIGTATRVYDAVHLVIKERLNKIKGRKAIVLFSDGVDTASYQATYESTIRGVEELDALIYPIQYDTTDYMRAMQGINNGGSTVVTTTSNGPFGRTTSRVVYNAPTVTGPNGGPLPGSTQADYDRANKYLNELADKTAGRLYKANDPTELARAFSQIAEELRRQYSLSYYPEGGASNADRRQIKVRVNRPNMAVKARDSYVKAAPPAPAPATAPVLK